MEIENNYILSVYVYLCVCAHRMCVCARIACVSVCASHVCLCVRACMRAYVKNVYWTELLKVTL